MTSRHSSETTCLERGEHLALDRDLLEHRLDHEVAAGEGVRAVGRAVTIEPRKRAFPSLSRPARDLLLEVGRGSQRRPPRPAPASTSVITIGTSSRRRNSVASWVAISPAPTTPTFWIRRGFASGMPSPS